MQWGLSTPAQLPRGGRVYALKFENSPLLCSWEARHRFEANRLCEAARSRALPARKQAAMQLSV